jgi:hypothetical protein
MKTITIFADGGMGNRFGSLVGGLITAKQINAVPMIAWPQNNWCGCSYSDLFVIDKIPVTDSDIHTVFQDHVNTAFLIHENQSFNKLSQIFAHTEQNINLLKQSNFGNIVYYHNKVPPYYSEQQIIDQLGQLKINSKILEEVKRFCQHNSIDKNTIGLHLRKTDVDGVDDNKLYRQVIKQSNIQFFVCSDDLATEQRFSALPNVYVHPKTQYVEKLINGAWRQPMTDLEGRPTKYNVNRSAQSVIEAFIDLLILSQTTIQFTIKSSFSKFAEYFSNVVNNG